MWIVLVVVFVLLDVGCAALYFQNKKIPILGHIDGMLTPIPATPNAVSSQIDIGLIQNNNKYVKPLPFKADTESTMTALVRAIEEYGGGEVITKDSNYLYVVFTSKVFKFKDDVEFYLDSEQQIVHYRSSSRSGKSDFGVNKQRYIELSNIYTEIH